MKLNKEQKDLLKRLTNEWQSSYDLNCNITPLIALVNKGLAEKREPLISLFGLFTSSIATEFRRKI